MTIKFPQLPKYEFSWRSLQVEPVPLSGERITLGTIVKGGDQALIAAKLIHKDKLKKMFGDQFGGGIADALSICINSAENFYSNKPLSTEWIPPLDGFHIGKINSSLAVNIEEGLFRAAMHCSSFSFVSDAQKTTSGKSDLSAPESWRKNILKAVTEQRADFVDFFEKSIAIRGSGVPITFGFLSSNYAAQFDAVPDVGRIHQTLIRAQSKLWQLDRLRDEATLFKPELCELLVRIPSQSENVLENSLLKEFVEELRYEAARRSLGVYASESHIEAALHVISQAA
jgi:hypothetical protein